MNAAQRQARALRALLTRSQPQPLRTIVRRGARRVEITTAPRRETR